MKQLGLIIFVICFTFTKPGCYAQYITGEISNFQKLTTKSGLSNNTVKCILKDKTGFVWIGTESGLNRFDGKNIDVLSKEFNDKKNLSNLHINDLYEDLLGRIWIATQSGLFCYYSNTETVEYFPSINTSEFDLSIYCLEPENESQIWLGTGHGLKLFDVDYKSMSLSFVAEDDNPTSLSHNRVFSIHKSNNRLWVGTGNGLNLLNSKRTTFQQFLNKEDNPLTAKNNKVYDIETDLKGNIWIGTELGGLIKFDFKNNTFSRFLTSNSDIPHNEIHKIQCLKTGELLIGTNGGGFTIFDPDSEIFYKEKHEAFNFSDKTSNSLYAVLQDYEGILWLGLTSGGVIYSSANQNVFKHFKHIPGNDSGICENNIRSLFVDSGQNLWIGTLGGITCYDGQSKRYTSYSHDSEDPTSLSHDVVTSFTEANNSIWVATFSGGLNEFDKKTKQFKHHYATPRKHGSISSNNISALAKDKKGRVYAATDNGLNVLDNKSKTWERVTNVNTRDVLPYNDTIVFSCEIYNISAYNPESKSVETFDYNHFYRAPLSSMTLGEHGKVWFAIQKRGLGCFDISTKAYSVLTIKDGLPSNNVMSIEKYGKNSYWISTDRGLSHFNSSNNTFTNYGLSEGLPFVEFYSNSSECLPDGSLAFGSNEGLLVFHPRDLGKKTINSKLRFKRFEIDGITVDPGEKSPLKQHISTTKELDLKYAQNDFAFEFIDIDFMSQRLGNYEYKLENYMSGWKNIGAATRIGFTNMDPGAYVLKVRKAEANPQKDYKNEISMKVNIAAPFYMTWYFYLMILLLLVVLMKFYQRFTVISINQKNEIRIKKLEYEQQKEFTRLRMKFFTYISHELRTPLSLISDPVNQLLKENHKNKSLEYLKLIKGNTERLKRLVNQILDFQKLENDAIKLMVTEKTIEHEVYTIYSSFEQLALNNDIDYRFESSLDKELTGWIDSDKLEKMMYNLLSNAFKFTSTHGMVQVRISPINSNKEIEISISDNGKGLPPEKKQVIFEYFYSDEKHAQNYPIGVGVGLSFVKRLVDLHHGTIRVETEEGHGAEFIIQLPIKKEAYSDSEIGATEKPSTKSIKNLNEHGKSVKLAPDVPTILVVEDEDELRHYLVSHLSKKFKVLKAVNGAEALHIVKAQKPDLILSDNVMPVMNGIEFCNALKEDDNLSHIPFFFLSAWNSDEFKLRGLIKGADDYISKPFNYDILEAKITNVIYKRRSLLEITRQMVKVLPENKKITTHDERFMLNVQEILEKNLDNAAFKAKDLEKNLFMSHASVYNKLKNITGLTANEIIREFRIRRAVQIFEQDNNLTVKEISAMVGFNDQKYFSICFKRITGVVPSKYNTLK